MPTKVWGLVGTIVFLLLLGLLTGARPQPAAHAQSQNQAALVVSYAEGDDVAVCVPFEQSQITGIDLLRRSGLAILTEPFGGNLGEAICRIDATGCGFPQEKCFCECQGADCVYWSYWRLEGGEWLYSQQGAAGSEVQNGSVYGWVWGPGTLNQSASRKPPQVTFEQVCAPTPTTTTPTATQPTATQTGAATATQAVATNTPTREPSTATPTPIPSLTLTPTPGPTPTVTPTPYMPPTIRVFASDRTPITFGENVTLVWDVADSTQVLLRYPGGEEVVPAQGSRAFTPETTTEFSLVAASPVGQAEAVVAVVVNPVISAPTPQPGSEIAQAAPTDTPVPPEDTPTWTPTWTATWTPMPTETSTATPEPVALQTQPPVPPEAPAVSVAQAESPLVITVVATPDAVAAVPDLAGGVDANTATATTAGPVVVLNPDDVRATAAAGGLSESADGRAERAFLASGLAFVVGAPLLFAGIWLLVWFVWKRR